ncbi:MAG: YncE family protein [Gemmatimonadota bacterium]
MRSRLQALLLTLFVLGCSASAGAAPSSPAADAENLGFADELLYVCNQDDASVTIIDVEAREVVRTVDLQALGFSENARPHHIAVEPDGSYWYVSLIGEGVVAKIDRNDELAGTAPFGTPGMLTLDGANDRLYVARSMTAVNPPRRIGEIRTSDMTIEEIDVFFPRPHALVMNRETGIVYTASLGVNQVAALDPETDRAILTDVDGPPHALMQFAISPDGSTLAISGEISHTLHLFDISEDPLQPRHLGAVEVGLQPFDPIFTADGSTVWLGNKAENTIMAVDVETREVVRVLDDDRIREPHGATATADGRWIIISNANVREGHTLMLAEQDEDHGDHAMMDDDAPTRERVVGGLGRVTFIDAQTGELVTVVEVGQNASGIALGPR